MTIGNRIKERRELLGMSVDDLAEKVGKNRATVYRYENGSIENMPLAVLVPIAEALLCTPAYLMGWEDEDPEQAAIEDVALLEAYHRLTPSGQTAVKVLIDTLLKADG